jgi:carbamoyltransferase
VAFEDYAERECELIEYVAERLVQGAVVAWCQGRMEFGPRALGARSILADPRGPAMRTRINRLVKKREEFRPFAPAVLDRKRAEHFDLDHESPFMLEVCQVTSPLALPAITHVDGSVRVQTVNEHSQPRFRALIEEFDRRTGCPMLLNTSLNLRGEPIACDIIDVVGCFVRAGLDVLVIEDCVVESVDIPPLWQAHAMRQGARTDAPAVSHAVYTFL